MLSDSQRDQFERRIGEIFLAAGAGQSDTLLTILGSPPDVTRVPLSFWLEFGNELMSELEPVLVEIAVASARALGDQAGVITAVNWQLINRRAEAWAEQYSFDLVKGLDVTSRERLQRMVAGFIATPEQDLKSLGAEIANLFGPVRGEAIATTEATRAASQGELALAAEIRAGNPAARIVHIWLTSNDELVCPVCGPLHGRRRGQGWTAPPPAHPRCRCAMGTEFLLPEELNG